MRNLIRAAVFTSLISWPSVSWADEYNWPVINVIEGNTLVVDARATFPDNLALIMVSVPNIEVPQSRPRAECAVEAIAAREAIRFTHRLTIRTKKIVMHDPVWGHLGGQVFARISFDGLFLSDLLIEAGFAREYEGGPMKGWCDGEESEEQEVIESRT